MRVGNQAELSKYLSLAGGDITGRLGVSGVLEVGKTGTESLITLGASTVLRDNANNALVISSESGAGSKAGVFLRPIASADSTMQMQGNADGWFTDKFTPKFSRYPERMPSSKVGRIPIPKEARHSIRLMVCLCRASAASTEISDSLKWWAKGHISALKSKAAIKRHGWSSDITGAL